jgi:integrase
MEFDILEYLSRWGPNRYNIAMQWDGYGKNHKSTGNEHNYVEPDKDGFITAGLLWTPGEVTYFANGKQILHRKDDRISTVASDIIFTIPSGEWDKGIDGRLFFNDSANASEVKEALISVKGGHVTVTQIRDLRGVIERDGAANSTKKLYARFYDHKKVRRKLPLFADRESTTEAARSIERLVNHRASGLDLPPELQRFIQNTLPSIQKSLVAWDIIDQSHLAAIEGLSEYLSKWEAHLLTKGSSADHVTQRVQRVRRLFTACGFSKWSDIKAVKVADQLSRWRKCPEEKMSAQTSNFYLQAARGFCKFMRDIEKCVTTSPLSELSFENVKADRRHDRRAFSLEEFKYLLGYLTTAKTIWNISAAERALVYQFAAETGLRLSSIRRIEVRSFGWDKQSPAVKVFAGALNKNPRERWVAFTFPLWGLVAKHIEGRRPFESAFKVPSRQHAAKLVAKDVGAARQRWIDEASDEAEQQKRMDSEFLLYRDHRNRHLDFHSFRHTRAVWPFLHHDAKAMQVRDLLGVSSLELVQRYAESFEVDHAVIHRGPDLTPTLPAPVKQGESLAPSLAQTGGLPCTSTDSGVLGEGLVPPERKAV